MTSDRPKILNYQPPKDRESRFSRADVAGWVVAILVVLFLVGVALIATPL